MNSSSPPLSFPQTRGLIRTALLFFVLILIARSGYYSVSKGFCLKRIQSPLCLVSEDLSLPPMNHLQQQQLKQIVNQPFHYLIKGSQAYAFVSEDGQYILKLLKVHHLQSIEWLSKLPCPQCCAPYRDSLVQRKKYRTQLTLSSYKLATEHLSNECALIYAQVLPSHSYTIPVTLHDAVGRTYHIDLNQTSFALQKKASLVLPSLEYWIEHRDMISAKKALRSMVGLIRQRSLKGIEDIDPDLHKNAGLIGTTAVHIDIGSFRPNESIRSPQAMQADMEKIFARLHAWLQLQSKELSGYLQELLDNPETVEWTPFA